MGPLEIALLVGLGLGTLIGPLVTLAAQRLLKMGKALIVWVEGDGRTVSLDYVRVKDGGFQKGNRSYLLDGMAKHGGNRSAWLLDPSTGWNLRAPTRKETFEKDLRTAVLEASNPESYHRAMHRKRWDDLLRAGDDAEKYKWVVPVAMIGLAAIVATLGIVAWMATQYVPGSG